MTQSKTKKLHPATLIISLSLILFLSGCGKMMTIFGHQSPQDSFLENTPQLTIKDLDNFKANLKPINTEIKAKYLLARHFQRLNRHLNAIEELNEVIKMEPYFPEAYNALGVSYDSLGKFAMAEECYKMALRLNPDLAYVVNNLGYSHMMQGKLETARQYLEMAVAMEENNLKYRNNLELASKGSENKGQNTPPDLALQSEPEQTPEMLIEPEQPATETVVVAETAETISEDAEIVKNDKPSETFQSSEVIPNGGDEIIIKKIDATETHHDHKAQEPTLSVEVVYNEPEKMNTPEMVADKHQDPDTSAAIPTLKPETLLASSTLVEPATLDPEPLNTEHSDSATLNTESLNPEHSQDTEHSQKPYQSALIKKDDPENGSRFYKVSPFALIENQVETRDSEKKDFVITIAKVSDESASPEITDITSQKQTPQVSSDIVEIVLVNGNGINGFAKKTGNYLKEKGYRIRNLQNADHFGYKETKIYFHKNLKENAFLLSEQLPGDTVISDTNMVYHYEKNIRVLLGKDLVFADQGVVQEYQIEISNGNGVNGAAKRMSVYLRGKGFPVNRLTNADHFNHEVTRIFFGKDQLSDAQALLETLPAGHQASLVEMDQDTKKIRLLIGKDVVVR
jgi:tetratricopeptide (TPR) repeat protein